LKSLTRQCSIYSGKNVGELVELVCEELQTAGISEPKLGAQYILGCAVMGQGAKVGPLSFQNHSSCHLRNDQLQRLGHLIQLKKLNIPTQYLVGNWDFHNICLKVRPPVFIPRPETEELVNLGLDHLPSKVNPHILEVGPGCGAISLAMLAAREDLEVTAVERSAAAVDLTLENARDLNFSNRLTVVNATLGDENFKFPPDEIFDMIISNPPYILRKDLANLAPEIYLYEDMRALDGGAEGLDVILAILDVAKCQLAVEGYLLLEVDPCHPHILPSKLEATDFIIEKTVKDHQGKDRFLVLQKTR